MQYSGSVPSQDFSFVIDLEFAPNDFIAAPVVGYAWQRQRFRLATELEAFWTPISMTSVDSTGVQTTIALEHEYVWLIRPAYQLFEQAPLFLYGNFGVSRAQIVADADDPAALAVVNFEKNIWGYKVGAGLGYDITPHWNVRLDYIFSQYQTITNTAPQDLGGGIIAPIDLDLPSTQSQYLFGMTYQW